MRKFSARLTSLMSAMLLSIGILTVDAASAAEPGGGNLDFAAQAKDVGLTTLEARSLQDRVDSYLVKVGGTQVGINKIRLNGGQILLALPGEQRARDLDAPIGIQSECPYEYFCAYKYQNFVGDSYASTQINMWYCQYYSMPWAGYGSFRNNQTTNTVAKFYNRYYGYLTQTLGAYTQSTSFNWTPVWYVKPC